MNIVIVLISSVLFFNLGWSVQTNNIVVESRIFGGEDASESQFPYLGYLSYGPYNLACGASVIHPRWVLTAGHCTEGVSDNKLYLTLGTTRVLAPDSQKYSISIIHLPGHYTYNASKTKGGRDVVLDDIALCRVDSPIEYSNSMKPIVLDDNVAANYENQMAEFAGWGTTKLHQSFSLTLKWTTLRVLNAEDCKNNSLLEIFDESMHMCTSDDRQQQGCHGDSGGPLVLHGKQVGVAVTAYPICTGHKATAYIKVAKYVPWIREVLIEIYNDRF